MSLKLFPFVASASNLYVFNLFHANHIFILLHNYGCVSRKKALIYVHNLKFSPSFFLLSLSNSLLFCCRGTKCMQVMYTHFSIYIFFPASTWRTKCYIFYTLLRKKKLFWRDNNLRRKKKLPRKFSQTEERKKKVFWDVFLTLWTSSVYNIFGKWLD